MTTPDPTDLLPHEVSRAAERAGLPLDEERLDLVTATANHIQRVLGVLRTLDLAETTPTAPLPAPSTGTGAGTDASAGEEPHRATV